MVGRLLTTARLERPVTVREASLSCSSCSWDCEARAAATTWCCCSAAACACCCAPAGAAAAAGDDATPPPLPSAAAAASCLLLALGSTGVGALGLGASSRMMSAPCTRSRGLLSGSAAAAIAGESATPARAAAASSRPGPAEPCCLLLDLPSRLQCRMGEPWPGVSNAAVCRSPCCAVTDAPGVAASLASPAPACGAVALRMMPSRPAGGDREPWGKRGGGNLRQRARGRRERRSLEDTRPWVDWMYRARGHRPLRKPRQALAAGLPTPCRTCPILIPLAGLQQREAGLGHAPGRQRWQLPRTGATMEA